MTTKDRNLVKGSIRRVFSRSDLRKLVIDRCILKNYTDIKRKRVKTWCLCPTCKVPTPKSYMEVDHIDPIIPTHLSLDKLSWDELVDRIWCEISNLQPLCSECHDKKTKEENIIRRAKRKELKDNE